MLFCGHIVSTLRVPTSLSGHHSDGHWGCFHLSLQRIHRAHRSFSRRFSSPANSHLPARATCQAPDCTLAHAREGRSPRTPTGAAQAIVPVLRMRTPESGEGRRLANVLVEGGPRHRSALQPATSPAVGHLGIHPLFRWVLCIYGSPRTTSVFRMRTTSLGPLVGRRGAGGALCFLSAKHPFPHPPPGYRMGTWFRPGQSRPFTPLATVIGSRMGTGSKPGQSEPSLGLLP